MTSRPLTAKALPRRFLPNKLISVVNITYILSCRALVFVKSNEALNFA